MGRPVAGVGGADWSRVANYHAALVGGRCRRVILSCFGPTTPTRPPGSPLALWRLSRLSCCRTSFASEQMSPSARERVPVHDGFFTRILLTTSPLPSHNLSTSGGGSGPEGSPLHEPMARCDDFRRCSGCRPATHPLRIAAIPGHRAATTAVTSSEQYAGIGLRVPLLCPRVTPDRLLVEFAQLHLLIASSGNTGMPGIHFAETRARITLAEVLTVLGFVCVRLAWASGLAVVVRRA